MPPTRVPHRSRAPEASPVASRRRAWWRHPVVQFVAAGVVALIVILVGSGWFSSRAATDEAVMDARYTTELLAHSVVQPRLPQSVTDLNAGALDRLDALVRERVLRGDVLRVKLWADDGTILYSDQSRLIGKQFQLGDEELDILWNGGSDAEASDLSEPENEFERQFGRLLEVYTQVHTRSGQPLLFEAYFSYDDVHDRSAQVLNAFRPITVAGLLMFLALTVPLVWVLARRLDRAAADRERLLLAAMEASDAERRRIARDLHDGVVQDLAGTSFALSATARDLTDRPEVAARLDQLGMGVRHNLRALRSLLVEIYPPDLGTEGLAAALDDLVAPAAAAGITVGLRVDDTQGLPDEVIAISWRTAQETVRNAIAHAAPRHLDLTLTRTDTSAVLEVRDDGTGFQPDQERGSGHLGLRALGDLVREAGGTLDVSSAPGQGTVVRMEVPTWPTT